MAYDKKKLYEAAIDSLKKDNEIVFIEDLCLCMGISKPAFYSHFPPDSNEYNELRALIQQNKTNIKKSLRKKWYLSDNATLNICAYKLLSNDEERSLLADKQEVTQTTRNIVVGSEEDKQALEDI